MAHTNPKRERGPLSALAHASGWCATRGRTALMGADVERAAEREGPPSFFTAREAPWIVREKGQRHLSCRSARRCGPVPGSATARQPCGRLACWPVGRLGAPELAGGVARGQVGRLAGDMLPRGVCAYHLSRKRELPAR